MFEHVCSECVRTFREQRRERLKATVYSDTALDTHVHTHTRARHSGGLIETTGFFEI